MDHRRSQVLSIRNPSRRTGSLVVLSAFMLIVVFAFTAFTVDLGYMNILKGELQNAADAASLAAAADLPDGDAAAVAAGVAIGSLNQAGGANVVMTPADVEIGTFDFLAKTFVVGGVAPNAVRATARKNNVPYFFAPVLGQHQFNIQSQSIAMLNPRDIVFVVDTSGSMNDDTEPAWATETINELYGPLGYPSVATDLMEKLYSDLGYGTFPGAMQYLGFPLGVDSEEEAFAEMSKDDGPLADAAIPDQYRILSTDDEWVRRVKTYSWVIDYQIAVIMPAAKPTPDSSVNYEYWEKYIDYIMDGAYVGVPPPPPPPDPDPDPDPVPDPDPDPGGGGGGGGGEPDPPSPPAGRFSLPPGASRAEIADMMKAHRDAENLRAFGLGDDFGSSRRKARTMIPAATLAFVEPSIGVPRRGSYDEIYVPWYTDGDEIDEFNNPNIYNFPGADADPDDWENIIGYFTYVQFMMDWGRDRSPQHDNDVNPNPALGGKTPLSRLSPDCPLHTETTAGGTFQFPPREQPMHATRRALIAALNVIKNQNAGITNGAGDRVAVISFDGLGTFHTPQLVIGLTDNFTSAMQSCATLQAVSDIGNTTAIEAGIIAARNHLKIPDEGGSGRDYANKVIVLLTDGVPNSWQSSQAAIDAHIAANPSVEYYNAAYVWYNSALRQAAICKEEETHLFSVGVGLGCDYDFMDRMARLAGTDDGGLSPRGSGNPAEYETQMTSIFTEILRAPGSRLVE